MRLAACGLFVAFAARANAGPALVLPIAIEYVAAAGCPDEISLRAGVIARLGQDPFRGDAQRHALIDVTRTAAGYVAAIELHEHGREQSRRVVGPAVRCEDAVDALELALAVIIDPTAGAPPPVQPVPAPIAWATSPVYTPPASRDPVMAPPTHELAVAVGSISGAHPESVTTFGFHASFLFDVHWSVGLDAHFGRSRGNLDSIRYHSTATSELVASGCARRWLAIGCVLAGIGNKSVTIDRDDPMFVQTRVADYSKPYGLVGTSVALDIPLGRVFLRPTVALELPLPNVPIESEGVTRADLPLLQLAFDLALGLRW